MPTSYDYPGVYVEEAATFPPSVARASTDVTAFMGRLPKGPTNAPTRVESWNEAVAVFGALAANYPVTHAIWSFFQTGGRTATILRLEPPRGAIHLTATDYLGDPGHGTGLYGLGDFDILCIPPDSVGGDTPAEVYGAAAALCAERRAMLIVDPPAAWTERYRGGRLSEIDPAELGLTDPVSARSAAVYFPRLVAPGQAVAVAPSGAVAGVWAATDVTRAVWKAPAGLEAGVGRVGVPELALNDHDSGVLNPLGINLLRAFPPQGPVVWGARTLAVADSEYRYVPVRRLVSFVEASLAQSLSWIVQEPNAPKLWAAIVGATTNFLTLLWREGALAGEKPSVAFDVRCGLNQTMTSADVATGVVILQIGLATSRPGEFVISRIRFDTLAG